MNDIYDKIKEKKAKAKTTANEKLIQTLKYIGFAISIMGACGFILSVIFLIKGMVVNGTNEERLMVVILTALTIVFSTIIKYGLDYEGTLLAEDEEEMKELRETLMKLRIKSPKNKKDKIKSINKNRFKRISRGAMITVLTSCAPILIVFFEISGGLLDGSAIWSTISAIFTAFGSGFLGLVKGYKDIKDFGRENILREIEELRNKSLTRNEEYDTIQTVELTEKFGDNIWE